jgi:hypothetical protein
MNDPNKIGSQSTLCAAECAARFEPVCANMGFFATSTTCFRAGLVMGKCLKRVVSAEGIESALKRKCNKIQGHG